MQILQWKIGPVAVVVVVETGECSFNYCFKTTEDEDGSHVSAEDLNERRQNLRG